jgi:hypothetical protein
MVHDTAHQPERTILTCVYEAFGSYILLPGVFQL